MKISIVIPVYNSSLTLKECLDAVFDSNFKNFEVIVVSDNSKDNSKDLLIGCLISLCRLYK